jgi:oxygen-independent coproporphyrinogen-3 oxidase
MPRYVSALIKEIGLMRTPQPISTIYFGGGTPSLTPLESLKDIFSALHNSFSITPACEISFEANPEDATPNYLVGLRELGVNRLSVGVQTANATELTLFNRVHTFTEVQHAIHNARTAGFENVSADLIFGIPQQTLSSWQETLHRTLDLDPDHFSIYSLSLDFGTPLQAQVQRGLLPAPDADLAADMYLWADEELAGRGFAQYEISSWGRTEDRSQKSEVRRYECKHNLQYWHNDPYLGLGAGAHGFVNGYRVANVNSPSAYIKRLEESYMSFRAPHGRGISMVDEEIPRGYAARKDASVVFSPALTEKTEIDRQTEMNETMLTGLRLTHEGVTHERFRERFGVEMAEVYKKDLVELKAKRWLKDDGDRVRLTAEGRLVANWVFERFV